MPERGLWHARGIARTRIGTTVDEALLEEARQLRRGTDAALIDESLKALLARHRSARVDAGYAGYDRQPLDDPDAWGDLASFRDAASRP